MSEEVVRLPDDLRPFTEADKREQRSTRDKARCASNGNIYINELTVDEFRPHHPGELTHLESHLSESTSIAVLVPSDSGMPVRWNDKHTAFEVSFAARLKKLNIEIPADWAAQVPIQVVARTDKIDRPCFILNFAAREMVKVEERSPRAAAAGEGAADK
jgi:hypothetical protein